MPKVTLTFDCPEEEIELRQALNGARWEGVVWDLDQWLREVVKHGPDPMVDADNIRAQIKDSMEGLEFSP